MPKYEYACKSCGERIEVKQSFKDDPLTECPTCSGVLRKVFSSPGIVLRGPGFYRTDHRSPYRPDGTRPAEREKDREPAEAKAGAESKGGESAGGESKGGESAGGESKGGDSKGRDSNAGDSKAGDSKAGDSRGADSQRSPGKGGPSSSSESGPSSRSGHTSGSKDAARTA
jgi:putative FmdB family regulatory protein